MTSLIFSLGCPRADLDLSNDDALALTVFLELWKTVCPLGFPMKHGEYYGNMKNGEHLFFLSWKGNFPFGLI